MKLKSILLTAVATLGFTAATVAQTPFCASDTFTSITSLQINSNDVAVIGNKLYTIDAWSTPKTLTEYDVNTGISSLISNPPFTLGETSITSYNNNLYFFGGYTGSTSNLAKMYNISANTWTNLTNMPVSMTQASAVLLNNYIYITGGSLGVTNQYFLRYDPNLNTYTTLATPTPMFSNSKLVVYNNNIYCLGGHNSNGAISNNLFVYDSNLNQWSALSAMPFTRTKLAATVWGNYLYVFGGAINPLFTPQFNYYAYDFINNSWTVSTNSIPSAILSGAATINDTIYIANGSSSYKYFCAENCSNNTLITPSNNTSQTSGSLTFTASTSDLNPNFVWQSDFGQGFQTLNNFGNYSGVNTATLNIANVQLSEHNQPIRVISTSGNCIDTSNVAVINILDTCITNVIVYDTLLTTVTDTLIINATITGLNPPNNLNTIKVFPNPANDHITINYGNFASMSGYTLRIINNLGQVVFTSPINQQSSYIDLSTWSGNGIYFVQIIDTQNNTIENRKIVLQ